MKAVASPQVTHREGVGWVAGVCWGTALRVKEDLGGTLE